MIAKSEFSDVISGVVLLLEKQVEGMERAEIIDFLEALNTSDDKSLPAGGPVHRVCRDRGSDGIHPAATQGFSIPKSTIPNLRHAIWYCHTRQA